MVEGTRNRREHNFCHPNLTPETCSHPCPAQVLDADRFAGVESGVALSSTSCVPEFGTLKSSPESKFGYMSRSNVSNPPWCRPQLGINIA